jgi:hypothetical protein
MALNRGLQIRHGLFDGLQRFDDIFHGVLLLVCDSFTIAASS